MAETDSRVLVESNGHGDKNQSYTEVIVVRHGETEWNSLGKMQGHLDVDLNEIGRQQAVSVADRLSRETNISAIYSSDLNRALETANIIASKIRGLQVIKDRDLRERHLGALQGRVLQGQELMRSCPEAYEALVSSRMDQEIPGGGESLNQLYERCTSSVQRIGDKHIGERVVIVTHGGAIRSLYKRASPSRRPGKVLNTSISIIHIADGSRWSLKAWNDVSHLKQTSLLKSGFGGDALSG
ncbi:hypothetical protein V2J09_016448 [Rumex salicifolius]